MSFEIQIIKTLQSFSNKFLDFIGEIVTMFGEAYTIIIVLTFIYFVIDKKIGERICFIVFASTCINNTIKGLVKAPRPFQVDNTITGKRAQTATGFSFPSGHTQVATVTYVSLAINYQRKLTITFAIIIPVLVAISRMYLGVHFLKDVLVGAIIGIICAFLFDRLYKKYQDSIKSKAILYGIIILFFIPFTFVFYQHNFIDIEVYRDFYISFALLIGAALAFLIEQKYVNFDCSCSFKKRLIRYSGCLLIVMLIYFGLKIIFPSGYIFLDMLRYFLVSFVGLGIYPLCFKKLNLL